MNENEQVLNNNNIPASVNPSTHISRKPSFTQIDNPHHLTDALFQLRRMMFTKLTIHHLHTATFLLATRAFKPPSHPIAHTPQRYMSLVTISEAITAHADEDSVFIDGSWYMPNTRDGRKEYQLGPRITGARYFDIDDVW